MIKFRKPSTKEIQIKLNNKHTIQNQNTLKGEKNMIVNGEQMNFESDLTVDGLLDELDLVSDRVVVEINMDIVDKNQYASRILDQRDTIEIVGFVGGG